MRAFGVAIVLLGVLDLWVRISEVAGWTTNLGALGRLFLFLMILALTIAARRQNRPGPRADARP
jgi:hypothetical protein